MRAFIATCRKLGLPFLIERSRSGKGAHVWSFSSAPVAAWSTPKIGSYVLTQTMARVTSSLAAAYGRSNRGRI